MAGGMNWSRVKQEKAAARQRMDAPVPWSKDTKPVSARLRQLLDEAEKRCGKTGEPYRFVLSVSAYAARTGKITDKQERCLHSIIKKGTVRHG